MSKQKVEQSLQNLGKALERLQEALAEPSNNSLIIDGTIQRFEFVLELFWKTMKRLMEFEGIADVSSPRDVLKKAYALRWLSDETPWLQMLRDRNLTSHIYDEAQATEIYLHIKKNIKHLEDTFAFWQQRWAQQSG